MSKSDDLSPPAPGKKQSIERDTQVKNISKKRLQASSVENSQLADSSEKISSNLNKFIFGEEKKSEKKIVKNATDIASNNKLIKGDLNLGFSNNLDKQVDNGKNSSDKKSEKIIGEEVKNLSEEKVKSVKSASKAEMKGIFQEIDLTKPPPPADQEPSNDKQPDKKENNTEKEKAEKILDKDQQANNVQTSFPVKELSHIDRSTVEQMGKILAANIIEVNKKTIEQDSLQEEEIKQDRMKFRDNIKRRKLEKSLNEIDEVSPIASPIAEVENIFADEKVEPFVEVHSKTRDSQEQVSRAHSKSSSSTKSFKDAVLDNIMNGSDVRYSNTKPPSPTTTPNIKAKPQLNKESNKNEFKR